MRLHPHISRAARILVVLGAVTATATPALAATTRRAATARAKSDGHLQHRKVQRTAHHRLRAKAALDTWITAGPAAGSTVTSTTATLTFAGSRATSFRCSIDAAAYRTCTSPQTYAALAVGNHTFAVRAVNASGVADASPATRSWTVAAPPQADPGCAPPYSASSPWNTPVPTNVAVDPNSAAKVATMDPANQKLTSDPGQYTFPVYYADASTPRVPVTYVDGWFSEVSNNGTTLVNTRSSDPAQRVTTMPIPAGTTAADGYDAQIIVIDRATGDEWSASHFYHDATGYHAWNIGHYNTTWSGVPPYDANGNPFWIRGPGMTYLSGLIRPCEIAQGHIDHALAFAYPMTTPEFVYPATRSDGQQAPSSGMAEGTRLQLNPAITDATIQSTWGCTGACFTIAKTLQRYGMYIADGSGRPKIMPEYEATAGWNGTLTASTPSAIPLSAFRVVAPPAR